MLTMATATQLLEGLQILAIYEPNGACAAEHDRLFGPGVSPSLMTTAHLAKMEESGWFWDEGTESWTRFT